MVKLCFNSSMEYLVSLIAALQAPLPARPSSQVAVLAFIGWVIFHAARRGPVSPHLYLSGVAVLLAGWCVAHWAGV